MKRIFWTIAISLAVSATAWAQDWAKAKVDKSPRHLEWVKVKNGSGGQREGDDDHCHP